MTLGTVRRLPTLRPRGGDASHVGAVVGKAGRIDVLFNAIGMEDVQGTPLIEMRFDDFAHPVVTAMTTQFLTARAVARRMVGQHAGVIL